MSNIFGGLHYDDTLRPTLHLGDNKNILAFDIVGTLSFDTTQRYCIGWHDLKTGKNHPCPDQASTNKKYDVCPACQRRTGFNPAFYHASSISEQQEARNAEPHMLYLAYMRPNYIKVGISWAKRGIRRLLEQGARSAIILETFPTALVARQYEAKIAALDDIHETTPTRTKLQLLKQPYDPSTAESLLVHTLQRIEDSLKTTFDAPDVMHFDSYYVQMSSTTTNFTALTSPIISGKTTAVIGDIIFMQHDGRTIALPLKQYTGYRVTLKPEIESLDLPVEQVSLFG